MGFTQAHEKVYITLKIKQRKNDAHIKILLMEAFYKAHTV